MHLITFRANQRNRIGALDRGRGEVVDFAQAAPDLPGNMAAFIALQAAGLDEARRALASGVGRIPAEQVPLLAPMPRPARNILCVGKNYREHAREVKSIRSGSAEEAVIPEFPIIFTKATSSVIGPQEPIPAWLDTAQTTDYEGELAVVIGAGGRAIERAAAMRHVYGYTIVNDVTSRQLQRQHLQWFLGKSLDGFCPMGPVITTADEVEDVTRLRLQTRVNGELRQDGCVADLIFDIPALIETLSRSMTLEPGDIIATGTPAGVGMGFNPPRFLHAGDVVAITIEPIGTLENPVA
jgi:2-keto-4-pentenoate hydratase/2-oxohepta-3-ene-1,7-dioic acid hydratase in catechol pathway